MTLRLDWCSHEAAKYACEHWHYSRSVPVPPLVKIGVWESSLFKGTLIFSRGANPNLLKPFGLSQTQGCELTRVALREHVAPVSKILAIAIKFLTKSNPKLRLVVSYADPSEGHHGGIYQAAGWLYTGKQPPSVEYIAPDGKQWHGRMVKAKGWTTVQGKRRATWKPEQCRKVVKEGKHKYLLALDTAMRDQVSKLSKPYPKRARSTDSGATNDQLGGGGADPTRALISEGAENNG